MSVDTTLAVLYAQSGLSTNVANAAMVAPQASLAMTRVMAAESLRQEREKVEKSQKADNPNINDEEGEGKSYFSSPNRRQRHLKMDEEQALPVTPFLGNLLNMKI